MVTTIRILIKETQIGKYKSSLYWYKTEDGVWIDNSYFIHVEDTEGNLIEDVDKKRLDIPEVSMPPIRAIIPALAPTISKEPILIDPNSDFWIFTKKPDRPITVWITFDKETGERKIIDVVTGEEIGYGTPPPSSGYSWSGPHNSQDVWRAWRENAHKWFQKWCEETTTKGLATIGEIKSEVKDKNTMFYYALAHGSYSSAIAQGGSIYWHNIRDWILERGPIWFIFLGHCWAMVETGGNTFSHAFRKGSLVNTVTIGYYKMEECSGWPDSVNWQDKLFNLVDNNHTFKDAFDRATATYPRIESGARFVGDEKIGKEVKEMAVEEIEVNCELEKREFHVYGHVTKKGNGAIANANVTLDGAPNSVTSDNNGFYEFFVSNLALGEHTLKFTAEGYAPKEKNFRVE